jgi:hypothetical protein
VNTGWRGVSGGFALAAALLASPVTVRAQAAPGAAVDPATLEETLVELRVGRLAARTVIALTDGSSIMVSLGSFFDLAEIDYTMLQDGQIRAVTYPGQRALVIDAAGGLATLDGASLDLPPASLAWTNQEVFAATEVLETALGLRMRVDWAQLTATVRDPDALPVGRRLQREARWAALGGPRDSQYEPFRVDLEQGPFGGAVLDWRLSSDVGDMSGTTAYAVGAGARAFGGGLQVTARSLGPASQGRHQVDATYQRVFRDLDWLTQVRVGDGFVSGPRYRSIRGLSLTNAPFVRRSFFGVDSFAGRVGPGWDVELRQADRMVDVTRADEQGAFALDIPLRYGENALQVVAFGPHGEVVTTERLLLLGSDRLRGGAFEWGLSGGACRDSRCEATGNLDLRYGISNAWTVRGGVEAFQRDTLRGLAQPYLGVSGAVLPSLLVSAEGVHEGFLRGGLTFAPSPRVRVRLAHTAFSTSAVAPVLHDASRRMTTEADLLVRPLAHRPRWLVRGSVTQQAFDFGSRTRVQASSSFQAGRTHYETGVRREVDSYEVGGRSTRDYQFAAVTGMLPLPGNRRLWARADIEFAEASQLDRFRTRLAYQLGPGVRVEVGGGWQRTFGSEMTLTFSADLAQVRSLTQLAAGDRAPTRVTQVSQGTMHWNEATRGVGFSHGPGLERGGVSGYVFVDDNGNGLRDPDEAGVDGVRVVIGGRAVRTDEDGRHLAWDLVPFEPVDIWADSASIADPFLVPVRDRVQVVVPPSSFGRLDIPLTPSSELVGSVIQVTETAEIPVPYAELELVRLEDGAVRTVRTFSDGEIYEMGIKPGRYELRVASDWLGRHRLRPEVPAVVVDIEAGRGAAAPEPVVVRLRSLAGGG